MFTEFSRYVRAPKSCRRVPVLVRRGAGLRKAFVGDGSHPVLAGVDIHGHCPPCSRVIRVRGFSNQPKRVRLDPKRFGRRQWDQLRLCSGFVILRRMMKTGSRREHLSLSWEGRGSLETLFESSSSKFPFHHVVEICWWRLLDTASSVREAHLLRYTDRRSSAWLRIAARK